MAQTKLRKTQYDISAYTNSASSVIMPLGSSGSAGNSGTFADAGHVHPDEDSGWIDLTLQNDWAVYTTWDGSAQYRKIGKLVMVRFIHLYNPSNKTAREDIIAALPSGYRISAAEMYAVTYVPGSGSSIAIRFRKSGGYIDNDTAYVANTKISATALYMVG